MGRVECLVFLTHGIDLHISQGTVVTFSAVVDRLTISYSVTVGKLHSGFCVYEKLFKSAVRLTFLRQCRNNQESILFTTRDVLLYNYCTVCVTNSESAFTLSKHYSVTAGIQRRRERSQHKAKLVKRTKKLIKNNRNAL